MSDLTGRFIHLQFEPMSYDAMVAVRLAEAHEARRAVVEPEAAENTVRIIAQGNLHDEREYGVDGERERAVEAGVIDALEAGEGDGRFDDLLLAVAIRNSGVRFGGVLARILDALGPLAENLVIVDMAEADPVISVHESASRAFVNRVIDADMNRLIIDEFASFPDPVDVLGPLHRQREALLWGERGKRAHVIDYVDLREPNDQRKGFYRDFEGKRPDGSFKRRKRGKRRG